MIFVAFFVPLALYLLVLGYINRRPRPLLVSGTWECIGLLFAASGFLLLGGPALLSSLNERWRLYWLLGESSGGETLRNAWQLGVVLSLLYFFLIVAGSAALFWSYWRFTSIYNVEPSSVEAALVEACAHLGLDPIRSGNLFVFGLALNAPFQQPGKPEGVQAPHWLPRARPDGVSATPVDKATLLPGEEFLGQNAILELEPFPAAMHVTLRWEPHDSPLRPALEAELERRLVRDAAPHHETGLWLSFVGFGLLGLSTMIVFVLVLRSLLGR